MPQIQIDTGARDLLRLWRDMYGEATGASMDYSEAIRSAHIDVLNGFKSRVPKPKKNRRRA